MTPEAGRAPLPSLSEAAARSIVPRGMVRMAPSMALPSLLRRFGLDPVPLVAEFGLSPSDFDDPEYLVSYEQRSRLLARCAEATRCPHFGLLVGQHAGLSAFGPVWFLMHSAADARSALAAVLKFFRLHNPNGVLQVLEDDRYVHVTHTMLRHDFPGREHVVDMSVAIMFNAMRALCGHVGQPAEVRLARQRPENTRPYQRLFRVPLAFDATDTGLVLPAAWLDRPLPSADPLLHRMMRQRIAELASQAGEDLVSRLRRLLPPLLAARGASVDAVARSLATGVRSLERRIAESGTSFAALRDEARYSTARQLLRDTDVPVREIAEQLGYANASALTAAFRRWCGTTPSAWRAAQRAPAPVRAREPAARRAAPGPDRFRRPAPGSSS